MKDNLNASLAFTGLKKDHGPPYKHFPKGFDPLDKNEYLLEKGVDVETLRNVHNKAGHVQSA